MTHFALFVAYLLASNLSMLARGKHCNYPGLAKTNRLTTQAVRVQLAHGSGETNYGEDRCHDCDNVHYFSLFYRIISIADSILPDRKAKDNRIVLHQMIRITTWTYAD